MRHALLLSLAALAAASARASAPERDFGFRPLEIYKFDNGTSRLLVRDLNGDGLDDVLFANNHVSRLEILLRKPDADAGDGLPELDDCFDNRGMIVDQGLQAIRVDDLDNDGRPDLVTFGGALGLQTRLQQEDGSFGQPERIFVKNPASVATIQVGDLNSDGLKDILVCRRDQAELLWNARSRPFQERRTFAFSGDKCYYGDIADINGDGQADLVFHFNSQRSPLRICYGRGDGRFGIEQPVDLPQRQYMDILQAPGTAPQVGLVLQNRLAFRLYGFEEVVQPPIMAAQEIPPGRIGLEGTGKKDPAWLAADFNADGFDDLLVAAPELSRLHCYSGGSAGLDPDPLRIDTLSDVDHLSRMANGDVLVVSRKEKIAALHAAGDLARFPAILNAPGDVLAGCAIETTNICWLVCKDDDKALSLASLSASGEATVYPLAARNDPSDLLAFELPGGLTGLFLFMPYDTPRMLLLRNGEMEELTSEAFRALAQPLTPANVRLPRSGDGSVIVVSQGAIARRFEWRGGSYEATRQYNPENPRGELVASGPYAFSDGTGGTLLYDRNTGDLVHFADHGDGWGKIHVPDADPTIFSLVQLRNPDRDTIVLLDRTGLNEIMGNGKRLETISMAEYVSPAELPMLAYAKLVHLACPPRPMVALVDPNNRAIELVGLHGGALEKELSFEVFLVSDFADLGKTRGAEPHDVESGDLNGDGIGDLVVLSQDKLLIYLGE